MLNWRWRIPPKSDDKAWKHLQQRIPHEATVPEHGKRERV